MKRKFRTLSYKQLGDTPIHIDIYLPPSLLPNDDVGTTPDSGAAIPSLPAVIYFHGGGLTAGNRQSWFPTWMHKRIVAAGYIFVTADYQLIPPATGHEIMQDIKDLLAFLIQADLSSRLTALSSEQTDMADAMGTASFTIDPEAIAVAGSSAGGLCAYLAAMHCASPKPKAVLSMYGMGADFLTAHYLTPKSGTFFRGREVLDPDDFVDYLYPTSSLPERLTPVVDSPLAYHPDTYRIPGYPANPRMLLARLYLQLGVFLDYYTGEHEPSLSSTLRTALAAQKHDRSTLGISDASIASAVRALIPERHHPLFPQFGVTSAWPPTILCHGSNDSAVPVHESQHLHDMLKDAGVPVQLVVFQGKEHSFDYEPDAEALHGTEFDSIGDLLKKYIRAGRSGAV